MSMKSHKKALFSLVLSTALAFIFSPAGTVHADSRTTYAGTNMEAQNYLLWSKPVQSYLTPLADGSLMRVQTGQNIRGVFVEYYDTSYCLISSKIIAEELPVFGGFYAANGSYFLVTGQNNPDESAEIPVFRITKYDKNWNRIGCAELKDCNTTVPFDAGSLRMDTCGKYLLIHTSHEMYRTNDGYNHQANVTIQLDMDTMTITDSYTGIMNYSVGYVSHSFNQFLKTENNRLITLDHGDGYPRSMVILKYPTDLSGGTFRTSWFRPCSVIHVMEFSGSSSQNITGAAAGGFELSASSYLTAGHSVLQNSSFLQNKTRNVFVAAADKATSQVTVNWLTSYAEGDGTTSTPQMVKLSDSEFVILWSRENTVFYTKVDDRGARISEIYSLSGHLSDCAPVAANGKIIWYTWENDSVLFYEITQGDLSRCETKKALIPAAPKPTGPASPSVSKGASVTTKKGSFQVTKAGGNYQAEAAFKGKKGSKLKKITIPSTVTINGTVCKVTSIAPKAFYRNAKLKKVIIGKNVKTIGKNAFSGCRRLKTIIIKSTSLKKVGKGALKGINRKASLKAPKKKRALYKRLFKKSTGFKKTMKWK